MVSCYSEPEFPVEPIIEFRGVSFVDVPSVPGEIGADTLKVTISYQDGDGDLGMLGAPVPLYDSVFNGRYIRIGEFDTLPEHNCTNYRRGYFDEKGRFIQSSNADRVTDTIYVRPNPFYYNFFLDIYVVNNGIEERFDFVEFNYPSCGESAYGRFSLDTPYKNKPISGLITYKFPSNFILAFFTGEQLKLKVRIADRAGHMSNIAESPVFTLSEIRK